MRITLLSFTLLLCVVCTYAQSTWQEYYNSGGIKFSTIDATCSWEGQTQESAYKFIKVENLTSSRVKISYQLEIFYQSGCSGCNGSPEYHSYLILEPNTQIVGSCTYELPIRLDILVHNPNLAGLVYDHFNIKDIIIDWID